MTLIAMTIPESPSQLAAWLERHLVGIRLPSLVAELAAVHRSQPERAASVREILGVQLPLVLEGGLQQVPVETLRQLLRQPGLLLELQDAVLSEGGAYWDALAEQSTDLDVLLERGGRRVSQLAIGTREPVAWPAKAAAGRVAWYERPWAVSLATAAAVLIAVFFVSRATRSPVDPQRGVPGETAKNKDEPNRIEMAQASGWGWSKPEALPANVAPAEYLKQLATATEEWFKQRPADAPALAKRIGEFRQGCSVLLLADHKPLPSAERTWLVARCKVWAARLDQCLTDLEAGRPAAEVLDHADETARQIAVALRFRADNLRA